VYIKNQRQTLAGEVARTEYNKVEFQSRKP